MSRWRRRKDIDQPGRGNPPINSKTMKIETIEVCRTCKHRQRWMNDFSPKVTQVCELKKGRTQMGFRKIKVTDPACDKYETEE